MAHTAPEYNPRIWNSSCNYTVQGIPASLFFARTNRTVDDPSLFEVDNATMFPLSPAYRAAPDMAVKACFGPGEQLNHTLVAAGIKMPCGYSVRGGQVRYWEENACRETITSNCYCYAINKVGWSGGYCMPGYRKEGDDVDFASCADAVSKIELDGAVPVSKKRVYSAEPPPGQHYIAMVLWPEGRDYHFFRRDADGSWSHKRGDTFVTNTYLNGSSLTDVEDTAILGAYKQFCGYFLVNPERHALTASYYAYQQSFVKRLAELEVQPGVQLDIVRLPHPSRGWAKFAYKYYLMGLDTAVFETGNRSLPWRGNSIATDHPFGEPQQQHQQIAAAMPTTAPKRIKHTRASKVEKKRPLISSHQHTQLSSVPSSWAFDRRPVTRTFSRSVASKRFEAAGAVQPHWMSHMQRGVPASMRDEAVRMHWQGAPVHPHPGRG
ncbi:hypothetical protein OEZ85_011817 [Tetradesmus obliquus]|uniref:Peptidase C1A papain C-terminal domain-containing protein n=1 Tax=Tetradesmus obliquus TaxID=3088 RepID=A0ABY8TRG6_TETOB|nr:hypothetical protein OEZ85_011817 [Tetradesmus obliquus]